MTEEPDEASQEDLHSVRSSHIGALVPAHVARGVFSTGVAVMHGTHEFVVDFLLQMQQPQQIVARVILAPAVVSQLIVALNENMGKYQDRFGPIQAPIPHPPAGSGRGGAPGMLAGGYEETQVPQPTAQDLYDQLKLPEDVMSGHYANAVMIGHTAHEFSLDFITTFFPRSAVVQRVFLSAANVPRLLDSLGNSLEQFRKRSHGDIGPPSGHAENN